MVSPSTKIKILDAYHDSDHTFYYCKSANYHVQSHPQPQPSDPCIYDHHAVSLESKIMKQKQHLQTPLLDGGNSTDPYIIQ